LVSVLLAMGSRAQAGDSCGCSAPTADGCDNEGKIMHCARRLCAWMFYQPNRCKDCKGLVTPVNYPPLYTFFPCQGNGELPPHTWCKSDCGGEGKGRCLFGRKKDCDACAAAPADYQAAGAAQAPDTLPAVPQQAQLLPEGVEKR